MTGKWAANLVQGLILLCVAGGFAFITRVSADVARLQAQAGEKDRTIVRLELKIDTLGGKVDTLNVKFDRVEYYLTHDGN